MKHLALLVGLAACTVGPDFRRPEIAPPPLWVATPGDIASRTVAAPVEPDWWRGFNDPVLDSLVERLVARNLDLREAFEGVLQADAAAGVAASAGLPNVAARSSYERQRVSPAGTTSLLLPAPGAPLEFDLFRNGLQSSWKLDLFGRVRRAVEAADARALAAVDVRRGIALSALATLASDYLQLRGTQARRDIAEANLRIAEQNVRLVQERFTNGVATTLDMAQARSTVATVAATIPALRREEAALVNAIGLLLAEPPRGLDGELHTRAALPPVPPVVPVGLPGTLVRRRPDVLEAEARLHAATAETGVAVADFYPDVSLTGMFDLEGLRLRDAFSLPARAFDVGPSISIPIFQGGRLRARLQLRESQQREAALAFQRTVLNACGKSMTPWWPLPKPSAAAATSPLRSSRTWSPWPPPASATRRGWRISSTCCPASRPCFNRRTTWPTATRRSRSIWWRSIAPLGGVAVSRTRGRRSLLRGL